jgi:hypothetical protein
VWPVPIMKSARKTLVENRTFNRHFGTLRHTFEDNINNEFRKMLCVLNEVGSGWGFVVLLFESVATFLIIYEMTDLWYRVLLSFMCIIPSPHTKF